MKFLYGQNFSPLTPETNFARCKVSIIFFSG